MSRRLRVSSLAALCLLTLGCAEPLAPSSVAGTYVMLRFDGAFLPAPITRSPSLSFTVVADTLTIDRDGRGRRVTVYDYALPSGVIERSWLSNRIRVVARSGQLYLDFVPLFCEQGCAPEPVHLLTPVGQRVYLRLENEVMEYQRSDPAP